MNLIIKPRKLHRFFYLEGADGMGKSTLAKRIEKELQEDGHSVLHLHFSGHVPAFFKDMLHYHYSLCDQVLAHLAGGDKNAVIMDRGPLSEAIYGPILRGKASFNANLLLTVLIQSGARLLLIETNHERGWANCMAKKETFTHKQWMALVSEYRRALRTIEMIHIDPFEVHPMDFIEAISDNT